MPSLQDLAEDAFAWIRPPRVEIERQDDLVLRNAPSPSPLFGMVLRPRLHDIDHALDRTRAWFVSRGRTRYSWWVSDASRPAALVDQLVARGLAPDEDDPVVAGMVLTHEPDRVPGIEVRKVASFEEALAAMKITWAAFDVTDEEIETATGRARERYELFKGFEGSDTFVALIDGEVVGSGAAHYLDTAVYLVAGSVAEHARGRGVYRALVRARWDEAVRRDTPALVVQAGKMSKPILERLGFERRCDIHILLDGAT